MNDNQLNESIHPRVRNGKTVHPKVNTAMPRRKGLSPSKLANMQKHFEQHPTDAMTAARLASNGK